MRDTPLLALVAKCTAARRAREEALYRLLAACVGRLGSAIDVEPELIVLNAVLGLRRRTRRPLSRDLDPAVTHAGGRAGEGPRPARRRGSARRRRIPYGALCQGPQKSTDAPLGARH